MTHFGVICPPGIGHVNPLITLGYELKQRGHRVSFVGPPYHPAQEAAEVAGLEFLAINLPQISKKQALEFSKKKLVIEGVGKITQASLFMLFDHITVAIQKAGIEVLLKDPEFLGAEIIAELLNLPYISIYTGLIKHQDISIPPFYTTWQYNQSLWALLRNAVGYQMLNLKVMPLKKAFAEYRQTKKLPTGSNQNYPPLAVISQQSSEFEFPRKKLPKYYHFTGAFSLEHPNRSSQTRKPVPFPWEKLSGQPLIYASMGTFKNRLVDVFEKIATACEGLEVQLVMSLGGGLKPEDLPELPGNPIVVSYAPQLELLKKATLTITHAGLNTTSESLSNGVPMVAIPVAFEQPGIAARIVWTGVGEAIQLEALNVPRLRKAITKVLTEDSYKQNAMRLQEAIKRAGGVARAADIIEQAVATGKPVLSSQFQQVVKG